MHIIMGGTGHVGAGVASTLLAHGEAVALVVRNADRAQTWRKRGAQIIEADVAQPDQLRNAFRGARRAFLLNPPADTSGDTDVIERQTVSNILEALEGSGLEKVVAASTAGAQAGHRIGDLGVLWELEQGLQRQPIPACIQRGAYYMSNWDAQLDVVRKTGKLHVMFPADWAIPMVAPRDLGSFAARRMMSSVDDLELTHVEGPRRYTAKDVASAFSQVLDLHVELAITPRNLLKEAFQELGFSDAAADSYARMTTLSIDSGFEMPADSVKGSTSLEEHLRSVLGQSGSREQD